MPGDDAKDEVDGENPGPETRGLIVAFVVSGDSDRLQHNDEQSQAHSELREKVMECDREREMDSVEEKGIHGDSNLTDAVRVG